MLRRLRENNYENGLPACGSFSPYLARHRCCLSEQASFFAPQCQALVLVRWKKPAIHQEQAPTHASEPIATHAYVRRNSRSLSDRPTHDAGVPVVQIAERYGYADVRVPDSIARLRQRWFWLPRGRLVGVAPFAVACLEVLSAQQHVTRSERSVRSRIWA